MVLTLTDPRNDRSRAHAPRSGRSIRARGRPWSGRDEQRTVVKRNSYAPFGETFAPTVIDGAGYTGHVMDQATGLTYMQQRYYDPQIGRFLSTDPLPTDPNSGAGFNNYAYANNNPLNNIDPDGREFCTSWSPCASGSFGPSLRSITSFDNFGTERAKGTVTTGALEPSASSTSEPSFSIPGTETGEEWAQHMADLQVQTGNDLYAIPGLLASLWTPQTAVSTALTAGGGYIGRPLAWAGGWVGRSMYASRWLGPAGPIIGRTFQGGSSLRILNRYPQLRFGWGYLGEPRHGQLVLRFSGTWIEAIGVKNGHIDLWLSPVIVTP